MLKLLIVDDSESKISHIVSVATEAGFDAASIVVVNCTNDARRVLAKQKFDLLIADLFVPQRIGELPSARSGADLIKDICEYDGLLRPTNIVGLSQYPNLIDDYSELFNDNSLFLELYSNSDISWLKRLRARLEYLIVLDRQAAKPPHSVDICVVAALHDPELRSLLSLNWNWKDPTALDDCHLSYSGTIQFNDKSISVVATAATRMGMTSTAVLSTKIILKYRPKILIMIGICAGFKGRCKTGDVLLAAPSWDWQAGKFKNGVFEIAPEQIDVAQKAISRLQTLQGSDVFKAVHDAYTGNKPEQIPEFRIGPVVSGSSVLADENQMSEINAQHRKLLGVDMEIFGLYAAARDCGTPTPLAFAVKAVSDAGDTQKSDDFRKYAAHISANALDLIIQRFHSELLN